MYMKSEKAKINHGRKEAILRVMSADWVRREGEVEVWVSEQTFPPACAANFSYLESDPRLQQTWIHEKEKT